MMSELHRVLSRSVAVKRNSLMSVPLEWHDWACWWTDDGEQGIYLHVHGNAAADPTGEYGLSERVFRVYPRQKKGFVCRRLSMTPAGLHWLYDKVRSDA